MLLRRYLLPFIATSILVLVQFPRGVSPTESEASSIHQSRNSGTASDAEFAADFPQPGDSRTLRSPGYRGWSLSAYPNPTKYGVECRTSPAIPRICDPDSILVESDVEEVAEAIASFSSNFRCESTSHRAGYSSSTSSYAFVENEKTNENANGSPVEIGVALMSKMDLSSYHPTNEDVEDVAAKDFAMRLHDDWGVGKRTSCGDTGILLFLSIQDRVCFISTGSALKSTLTNHRLDAVIAGMKPYLRNEEYKRAILYALNRTGDYIEHGPPTTWQKFSALLQDCFGLIVFFVYGLVVVAFKIVCSRREHRQRQEYAEVRSRLDRLDKDKAMALQGKYRCTSCPICFEDFRTDNSQTDSGNETGTQQTNLPSTGSDGRPLKLLRCGHVFDETCWKQWISSGSGDIRTCPICKKDVGGGSCVPVQHDRELRERIERPDHYEEERNFRLARLARRYPRYIRHSQIRRWTQDSYRGSLARDDAFVRSDPARAIQAGGSRGSGGFSGGSGGFGGGRSSGGRGGRW